jgi:hypothetical protein
VLVSLEAHFFRVLNLWRTIGDVESNAKRTGRPRLLNELLKSLKHNCFNSVHYTTNHRELERAGVSTKVLQDIAEERREPSRLDYVREISQYPAHYLGFLDETSKNDKTLRRRSKKGKRAIKRRKAVRGRRLTATGLFTSCGMLASTVVEASMHRDQYLGFLEHQVESSSVCSESFLLSNLWQLPLCSPYPGPLSVLIMDNDRIHHGEEILALCDRFGADYSCYFGIHIHTIQGCVLYIPPHSPDFNPTEEAFSKIKAWIRRNNDIFSYGPDGEPHALNYDMLEAMEIITESDLYAVFTGFDQGLEEGAHAMVEEAIACKRTGSLCKTLQLCNLSEP